MNDVLMKGALKMLKNLIPPEKIKEAARNLIQDAIDYKSTIVLNAEQNEEEAVAIFYEGQGRVFFALAILDTDNKITRFENVSLLDDLIDQLINKL